MFKKFPYWVLFLTVILYVLVLILYGSLLRHHYYGGNNFKSLRLISVFLAEIPSNTKKILKSISSNNFSTQNIYVENDLHKGKKGFLKYKNYKFKGLLILARYDGNKQRSVVEIVDLNNQKVLHTYEPNFKKILNQTNYNQEKFIYLRRDRSPKVFPMKNPIITNDGGLIFHGSATPLIKINFCSEIQWIQDNNIFHHSINKSNDGNYWIPSEIYPNNIDKNLIGLNINDNVAGDKFKNSFIDDAITKVSEDGKIIYQKSLTEIFIENNLDFLIFGQENFNLDPFHLNDIEEIQISNQYFDEGDLLLSLRNLSTIIHYRPSSNKVIRMINGGFYMQHDIDFVDDKTISIFDNNRINNLSGSKVLSNNKIKFFDFEKNIFYEKYLKITEKNNIRTKGQGLLELIDENVILIEKHEQNRLIISDKNEIILEFYNMANDGKRYNLYWSRYMKEENKMKKLHKLIREKNVIKIINFLQNCSSTIY